MARGERSSFTVQSDTALNRLIAQREEIEEQIVELQVR